MSCSTALLKITSSRKCTEHLTNTELHLLPRQESQFACRQHVYGEIVKACADWRQKHWISYRFSLGEVESITSTISQQQTKRQMELHREAGDFVGVSAGWRRRKLTRCKKLRSRSRSCCSPCSTRFRPIIGLATLIANPFWTRMWTTSDYVKTTLLVIAIEVKYTSTSLLWKQLNSGCDIALAKYEVLL